MTTNRSINLNDYENEIKFSSSLPEFNNESDNSNDPDFKVSKKVTIKRLKISNTKKLITSKSLVKRATNDLNRKNMRERGRKRYETLDPDYDIDGIKPKKEIIVCDFCHCDQVFESSRSYKRHKRLVHLKIRPFKCHFPDCDFSTDTKQQIRLHSVVHSDDRPFVCQIDNCGKKIKVKYQMKSHQKFVHRACAKLLRCEWPGCDYDTTHKRNLGLHMSTHTVNRNNVPCDWPKCIKRFRTVIAMREHRRIHTAAKSHSCSHAGCHYKTHKPSFLRTHMLVHSQVRPYVCDFDNCGKAFKTPAVLLTHKKTHFPRVVDPSRDFKCKFPDCDKDYITMHDLKRHSKTHLPPSIRCDWPGCTFITTTARNLRVHNFVHADYSERRYVCDWPECGKRFTIQSKLDDHFRQHTNEKRFACTFPGCGYRCVIKGNLNKHMVKHCK